MTKNPPAGERIAHAKRALEAAEFVDEADVWAHRLILDECQKAGEYLAAMQRVAEIFSIPYGTLWAVSAVGQRRADKQKPRRRERWGLAAG